MFNKLEILSFMKDVLVKLTNVVIEFQQIHSWFEEPVLNMT